MSQDHGPHDRLRFADTPRLRAAFDSLYSRLSSGHPAPMTGCPCCFEPETMRSIERKALRDVPADELAQYAFKADTTWGSVDDYKHYLPRILELSMTDPGARGYPGFDAELIKGKAERVGFQSWDVVDREAVHRCLDAGFLSLLEDVATPVVQRAFPMENLFALGSAFGVECARWVRHWKSVGGIDALLLAVAGFESWGAGSWFLGTATSHECRLEVERWIGSSGFREAVDRAWEADPAAPGSDSVARVSDSLRNLQLLDVPLELDPRVASKPGWVDLVLVSRPL